LEDVAKERIKWQACLVGEGGGEEGGVAFLTAVTGPNTSSSIYAVLKHRTQTPVVVVYRGVFSDAQKLCAKKK
jgi:hypothetical protein